MRLDAAATGAGDAPAMRRRCAGDAPVELRSSTFASVTCQRRPSNRIVQASIE